MKIWVSSLAKVHDVAAQARPESAVSLLSPGDIFPIIDGVDPDDHHKVHLHDIRAPVDGHVTPNDDHLKRLLVFLKGWDTERALLVHCWAGISRSTATAYIAACMHNPGRSERDIASVLSDASETAYPNTLIVSIADRLLGRDGRMTEAAEAICGDRARAERVARTDEARPFSFSARF